eukprot:COSAG06_NODE_9395_length_1912_cov_1.337010_3_plen_88_part_00
MWRVPLWARDCVPSLGAARLARRRPPARPVRPRRLLVLASGRPLRPRLVRGASDHGAEVAVGAAGVCFAAATPTRIPYVGAAHIPCT